jgi:hypothetical protein
MEESVNIGITMPFVDRLFLLFKENSHKKN